MDRGRSLALTGAALLATGACGAGCGSASVARPTDAASRDALGSDGPGEGGDGAGEGADTGGACSGQPGYSCVQGEPGGACSDVVFPAVCEQGTWRCPSGQIDTRQCGCTAGPNPCGGPPILPGDRCRVCDAGPG